MASPMFVGVPIIARLTRILEDCVPSGSPSFAWVTVSVTVKSSPDQGSRPRPLRVEARFAHRSEQYLLLLCEPTRKEFGHPPL
jgi:hypothetical protein